MDSKTLKDLIDQLFESKPAEKRAQWTKTLASEEFDTVQDLQRASNETWNTLQLPLAIKDALRQAISATQPSSIVSTLPKRKEDTRPMTQLDIVVFDISSSMNSRSFDPLNTRLGMAKTLFHSLVDKLVGHELAHGLGLVLFGQFIRWHPFTRDYEAFHDTLGNASADENSTKLYDSIQRAGQELVSYRKSNEHLLSKGEEPCIYRVFCLTDGEDNSSSEPYWQVAKYLQENNIILDSIPLATVNTKLQSMSIATGGLCFSVTDAERGVELFEREAVLRVAAREKRTEPLPTVTSSLEKLTNKVKLVEDVKSNVPTSMTTKVLTSDAIAKLEENLLASTTTGPSTSSTPSTTSTSTTTTTTSNTTGGGSVNSTKRILAEFKNLRDTPVPGFQCFISADDVHFWKVIMEGPAGTPYAGGRWVLYVKFPNDFPFKAPDVRFVTGIYHMNVTKDGKICLPILTGDYSPAVKLSQVFASISCLLVAPDPANAIDSVKANVYSDNRDVYMQQASQYTQQFASMSMADILKQYQIDQ